MEELGNIFHTLSKETLFLEVDDALFRFLVEPAAIYSLKTVILQDLPFTSQIQLLGDYSGWCRGRGKSRHAPSSLAIDIDPSPTKKQARFTRKHIKFAPSPNFWIRACPLAECLAYNGFVMKINKKAETLALTKRWAGASVINSLVTSLKVTRDSD